MLASNNAVTPILKGKQVLWQKKLRIYFYSRILFYGIYLIYIK